MNLNFFLLSAYSAILISTGAYAQTPVTGCNEASPLSGSVQAQVLETSKGCSIMLSPEAEQNPLRRYSFSQRGVIQIFNQYVGNHSGSRSFFVFPRAQIPTLTVVNANEMDVVTSAGDLIKFDTSANPPHIIDDPSASFRLIENPVVSASNNGGVEIVQTQASNTLVLDSGFDMGGAAFTIPTRTSTFRDSAGHACAILNNKLFNFANYDADLKFTNDASLFTFLKTACPNLNLPQ